MSHCPQDSHLKDCRSDANVVIWATSQLRKMVFLSFFDSIDLCQQVPHVRHDKIGRPMSALGQE
jgi:hypothetical protein